MSTGNDNSFKSKDEESSNEENSSDSSDLDVTGANEEESGSGEEEESEEDDSSEDYSGEDEESAKLPTIIEEGSDEEEAASSNAATPVRNPFFAAQSEDEDQSMDHNSDDSDEAADLDSEDQDSDNETADADINAMLAGRKEAQLAGKKKAADDNQEQVAGKRKKMVPDTSDESDSFDECDSDSDDDTEEKKESFPVEEKNKEDELIETMRAARDKIVRVHPPDIKMKEDVTGLSFHPEQDIIAVSNIGGEIAFFSYTNEENKIERKLKLHKSSIRCLEYSLDGEKIITGGKDKIIKVLNIETGQVEEGSYKHPSSLYSMCSLEHGAASGDEDGCVKIWDFREKKSVLTSKRFNEFVSSIYYQDTKRRLIAASGEGTIQTWDLRMNKADTQSELYNSELNCIASVKDDDKLVVGSSNGKLYIFDQGSYGHYSDEYPGHPGAINDMVAVTDKIIITGCEDGILRAIHLFPHKFIGQVGHHGNNMPSEKLDVNGAGNLIASTSLDKKVKFWDISYLEKMSYEKKLKPYIQKNKKQRKSIAVLEKEKEHQLPSSGRVNKADFFKDIESQD